MRSGVQATCTLATEASGTSGTGVGKVVRDLDRVPIREGSSIY